MEILEATQLKTIMDIPRKRPKRSPPRLPSTLPSPASITPTIPQLPSTLPPTPSIITSTIPTECLLFWDYENVAMPSNQHDPAAAGKELLQTFFQQFLLLGGARTAPTQSVLYFSRHDQIRASSHAALALSWDLRYIPNPRKKPQIVDMAILRDLQRCEARKSTLFIGIVSGDTDFLTGASKLQDLGHHVYCVLPQNAGNALRQRIPCLGVAHHILSNNLNTNMNINSQNTNKDGSNKNNTHSASLPSSSGRNRNQHHQQLLIQQRRSPQTMLTPGIVAANNTANNISTGSRKSKKKKKKKKKAMQSKPKEPTGSIKRNEDMKDLHTEINSPKHYQFHPHHSFVSSNETDSEADEDKVEKKKETQECVEVEEEYVEESQKNKQVEKIEFKTSGYYAHGLFSKHDKIIHSPAKNEYELSRGFVENEDDAEDIIVLQAASSNYDLKSW